MTKVLHGENQPPPFFIFLTWYEGDIILNLRQKVSFHITNIVMWLNSETSCPNCLPSTSRPHLGNPGLCTPGIKVLVNGCITEIFLIRVYIYIYIFSQKVHHNPCFNLFMLHNIQGSEIKNIFLHFNILPFLSFIETSYYQRKYYYLPTSKKVFVKDSKLKRKKMLFMYKYIYIYIYYIYIYIYI